MKAPAANEGRRRPTKMENGPQVCFVYNVFFLIFNLQLIHESPRRHSNQQSSTQAHKDGKKAHKGPQQPTKADAAHTGITLYRTIRFKERIQCIGPSEF